MKTDGSQGVPTKNYNILITIYNRSSLTYQYEHVPEVRFYKILLAGPLVVYVI